MILHKTDHEGGRIHDYEIFKNKHPTTPLQVENILDLGYSGVKDYSVSMYCHLKGKGKVNSQMKKRSTIESIPN